MIIYILTVFSVVNSYIRYVCRSESKLKHPPSWCLLRVCVRTDCSIKLIWYGRLYSILRFKFAIAKIFTMGCFAKWCKIIYKIRNRYKLKKKHIRIVTLYKKMVMEWGMCQMTTIWAKCRKQTKSTNKSSTHRENPASGGGLHLLHLTPN